jgi:hypothetical protein
MKHWLVALALVGLAATSACTSDEQVTEDPPGIHDISPTPASPSP